MPSPAERENSEWNCNRHGHSLKFRISGAGHSDLVVNNLYFFSDKSKVRRIKITCCELGSVTVSHILIYFFKSSCINIYLLLIIKSIFCTKNTFYNEQE